MTRLHPARGVTLLELVTAMAISAVVLVGVVGVVGSQQKAYTDGQWQREAQGSARSALLFIEDALLLAGYGMDAPLAFDFDRYQGPCPAQMGTCPRDATNNPDEIVFYNRNPRYWVPSDYGSEPKGNAWRITAITSSNVTFGARQGDQFLTGQILQAVCRSAAGYTYFTVSTAATAAADGSLTVNLLPVVATDPFRRQDQATDPNLGACFQSGQARLFRIDRHRFHVRPIASDTGLEPYLVLDSGLDTNGDGTIDDRDEQVLVAGVELLQFAYDFTEPTLAPAGLTPGTAIAFAKGDAGNTGTTDKITTLNFPGNVPAATSAYVPTSFYGYTLGPPPADQRRTDHQANIRGVRVAVRTRSAQGDRVLKADSQQLTPLFNLDTLPPWIANERNDAKYVRATFLSSVPIRNMTVRAMNDF
jgi:type IV pilus assembly protein PilW